MTNESKRQLYLSHSEEEGFQKFAMGESIQAGDKCGVHLLGIVKCDVRGLVSFVPLSAPFVGRVREAVSSSCYHAFTSLCNKITPILPC
jgi:hypothetical protein